jgi:hypothetical protein
MTDTAIIERDVIVPEASDSSRTPFSWSAAIVGAFAATAVTLLVAALGSGIGLSFASPYGSTPSATSLTVAAAVWLVMAQSLGFATGGYLAGRLRSPAYDGVIGETTFRDAAQGLAVWAIGVVTMAAIAGLLGLFAVGATVQVAASAAGGASRNETTTASTTAPTEYFVDLMFRPRPAGAAAGGQPPGATSSDAATVGAAPSGIQPTLSTETRAEVTRILARSVVQAKLDDNDRAYLARVVSARTGLPPDEAERRVTETEGKAREAVKETADKAAKAGAYFSFWTFMSMLFGGVAATLAGMLGGQLRDAEGRAA